MSNPSFTCAHCLGTFQSDWSEAEAVAEAREAFGDQLGEEPVSLCDDCYKMMTAAIPPQEWAARQRQRQSNG